MPNTAPLDPKTEFVTSVGALAEVLTVTTGAEIAFEAQRFPAIWTFAPCTAVPKPTVFPNARQICETFMVATFATLARTTGVVRAFDPKTFPATWRFDPGVKSPTPTKPGPDVAKMDAVLRAPTLADVLTMTTGV